MTMHTGESLALFSQPCRLLRYHEWLLVRSVLVGNGNESFASVLQTFLGVLKSFATGICLCTYMSATIPRAAVTCDYHVTVSPRTHEQLRDKKTLCCVFTPWFTVSHMAGGTSCTFVMLAQSAFPLCRPIRGILSCWLEPRCDPPTHLPFRTSTHNKVGDVLAKASWRLAEGSFAAPYSKMKVLFATLAVSITAHSVKLVQPQLTFGELVSPLVNNALCWARGTVRPVSQWWSTTIKMRNTMVHLLWVRQETRLTCSMTQAHL